MGYDVVRFQEKVDEEFICELCSGVLEEPLYVPYCEHAFCKHCINEWLTQEHICPVDKQPLQPSNLKPFPRILGYMLSDLLIKCSNATLGCTVVVKLEYLERHQAECIHNPKRHVLCHQGCGLFIPKDELSKHDCIKDLTLRIIQIPKVVKSLDEDKAFRWSSILHTTSVTDWGGLIPNPDSVRLNKVWRALILSDCPSHLTADLVKNANERRWPSGLHNFEARKTNRKHCENYVFKKIPGKQAVVVMSMDNLHMNNDLVLEPGFVMIFVHGIEC